MKIEELVTIEELEINKDTIHLTKKTKLWCQLPYKNHKKGCINYNCLLCPPNSPYFKDFINDYKHFYLVYAIFNFKRYKELRKLENPKFFNSEARLKCVIYWQNSVKSLLRKKIKHMYIKNFIAPSNFYLLGCGCGFTDKLLKILQIIIYSMESVGIYVFKTLKNNNIDFELKPVDKILLVCLLSSKVDLNDKSGGLF